MAPDQGSGVLGDAWFLNLHLCADIVLEVRSHLSTLTVSLRPLQENIRDKLRPIPITASVEIQEPSSRRRVNSLPEVLPILNSNEAKTVQTDVSFLAFSFASVGFVLQATSCGRYVWPGVVAVCVLLIPALGGRGWRISVRSRLWGGKPCYQTESPVRWSRFRNPSKSHNCEW